MTNGTKSKRRPNPQNKTRNQVKRYIWAKIGHNVGSEEFGKNDNFARPVIIVKKLTHDLFMGIPLTSTIKDNDYFQSFEYENKSNGLTKNSAMILQFRIFIIKRLMNKTGVINKNDFEMILEKCRGLFRPT